MPVVVVGSITIDLVTRVPSLPQRGETINGLRYDEYPGGSGLNQAIAIARQGVAVTLVGCVGRDDPGQMLLNMAAAEGVDTAAVMVADHVPTGRTAIAVDPQGDNMIVCNLLANAALTAGFVQQKAGRFDGASHVVAQLETPLDTVARAFELAHDRGATTVLTPKPAGSFDPTLYAHTDVLVPNETEAAALCGFEVEDEASVRAAGMELLEYGVGAVLMTLGERGLAYFDAHTEVCVPAFPVAAVDATGAGDSACGAFVAALATGADIPTALTRAAAAGALAVTVEGAVPAIPTKTAVDAILP